MPLGPPECRLRRGQRAFQLRTQPRRFAQREPRGAELAPEIGKQQLELPTADADPEEFAGQIRQLVRLIEHHRIDTGQQIAESLLFERQVRQQQMVVDHDDVGLHRRAARLEHVAAGDLAAARAAAVVARRGDVGPQRMGIREFRQLRQITAAGAGDQSRMRASSASADTGSSCSCRPMSASRARHR